MDHGFAIVMNIFNFSMDEIKRLSMNQFAAYVHHAVNILAGYRQGEMEFAYKNTKDDALRKRLKELQHDAELRKKHGN